MVTEMPDEMVRCPNCRRENLAQATRCVYCGHDLDSFDLEGLGQENAETGNPENLNVAPLPPYEIDPDAPLDGDILEGYLEHGDEPEEDAAEAPAWLKRIRDRAAQEDDVRGIYAGSPDPEVADDGASQFEAWKQEQEAARERAEAARKSALPPRQDGTPNWLKRVRDLQVTPEEEALQALEAGEAAANGSREHWSDEELEALRQEALGFPSEPDEDGTEQGDAAEFDQDPRPGLTEGDPQDELEAGGGLGQDDAPEQDVQTQPDPAPQNTGLVSASDGDLKVMEAAEEAGEDQKLEAEADGYSPDEPAVESLEPSGIQAEPAEPDLGDSRAEPSQPPPSTPEPDLMLLRSQRERAELLRDLVAQEGKAAKARPPQAPTGESSWRGLLGLLLLAALVLALLFIPPGSPTDADLPPQALAISTRLKELGRGQTLLVVIDYQAATEPELQPLAAAALEEINPSQIELASAQMNGLWLGKALAQAAGLPDEAPVSFIPGGTLNLLRMAINFGETDLLERAEGAGANPLQKDLKAYAAILLVTDSAENAQAWLGQIGPALPTGTILALTTMQEEPLLMPFYESGQLGGLGTAETLRAGQEAGSSRRAFELGFLAMIIFLLLGVITKFEADLNKRHFGGIRG